MTMKRFFCTILFIMLVLAAYTTAMADTEKFSVISIPYEDGERLFNEDYQAYSHLLARYKDDLTPIPVSQYYDGYMYATVPKENENREIEVFVSEETEFSDDNGDYEFYILGLLSSKDIIKGNENGEGKPFSNITRAEATAMVMRFMGVGANEHGESEFDDVTINDWYNNVVETARDYGIVMGDSETHFNPERNVSREEFIVMLARAMWCMGLQEEKTDATYEEVLAVQRIEDVNEISDWALSAYFALDTYSTVDGVPTDAVDEEGITIYKQYAFPKTYATRFEASEMIFRICDYFQIYPSQAAIEFGFDKGMPKIDGSTSTYPFTYAVYGNLFSNGYQHIEKPLSHSKSHASYERLIKGEVDMLFASVYPASDIIELAKENNVELELIPIAYDAMIFFTNVNNPATNLTKEQISDIYVNNSYSDWSSLSGDDALLYPYCRNNDSGSHAQMERLFLNGNEINEKIRKEKTSVTMSNVLTDVMGSETSEPKGYGLGYSIYYYFNNMDMFYNTKSELKLLSVDGVYPSDETIADGTYPLSNNTYVVLRSDTPDDAPARKMAEFMLTDLGQQCVEEAGFGKLK